MILFSVGVQIDYDVVHLQTSLVQLFVPLQLNFEEVVQIIKLRRFGGAPNGYPFAAIIFSLKISAQCQAPFWTSFGQKRKYLSRKEQKQQKNKKSGAPTVVLHPALPACSFGLSATSQ
jgi:hypothetical protein